MKNVNLLTALLLCLCASQSFGFSQNAISNTPIRDFLHKLRDAAYDFLGKKTIKTDSLQEHAELADQKAPKQDYNKNELECMGYKIGPDCDIRTVRHIVTVQELLSADYNTLNPICALPQKQSKPYPTKTLCLGVLLK